jgi:hypothetical protein
LTEWPWVCDPKTVRIDMKLILFFLFTMNSAYGTASSSLEKFCTKQKGVIKTQWTCPQSGEEREGQFCEFLGPDEKVQVVNGCTRSIGNYGELFFNACVAHDLCYHNEPQSSDLTKRQCDQKFLADMLKVCMDQNSTSCKWVAKGFFEVVEEFGDQSWQCSKNKTDYFALIGIQAFGRDAIALTAVPSKTDNQIK